jgi:hypothetical protein
VIIAIFPIQLLKNPNYVRFEVLTADSINITVFWEATRILRQTGINISAESAASFLTVAKPLFYSEDGDSRVDESLVYLRMEAIQSSDT